MKSLVQIMYAHDNEEGAAIALKFNEDFFLYDEDFGRTVTKWKYVDWVESINAINKELCELTAEK